MKFSILLLTAVMLVVSSSAHAGLTRAGSYVGARNIAIKLSLEEDMRRAGVPDQCREEAHQVLTQYVFYGYDTDIALKPKLDILCAFTPAQPRSTSGPLAKPLGQRGTVGGLRYIHFHNSEKSVKRYILPLEPKQQVSFFSRFVELVTLTPSNSRQCPTATSCNTGSAWATPISGARITSNFGHRHPPVNGASSQHRGMDYGAACGTPIMSVADGVVIKSQFQAGGAGNYIQIRHGNGVISEYFHMPALELGVGAAVTQGQVIGRVGSTGASSGCHLHFGTLVNGERVDPRTVLGTATNVPLTPEQAANLAVAHAEEDAAVSLLPELDASGGLAGEDNPDACYVYDGASRWTDMCDADGNPNHPSGTEHSDDENHAH